MRGSRRPKVWEHCQRMLSVFFVENNAFTHWIGNAEFQETFKEAHIYIKYTNWIPINGMQSIFTHAGFL